LADDRLDRLAVPPNLAKEHGTLNGAEAEVGHMLFVRFRRQTSKRLLLNKKTASLFLTTSKMRLRSCRISSSFSVTSFPTVPKGQPRVMRKLFCISICAVNQRSKSSHDAIS
jgi:hypothetical protein